ncbi:MAG: hypothetical protein M3410_18385 [Acidobacteriota bacterium]|nr:hypothetical protein [Acidobacteriota bacterium]
MPLRNLIGAHRTGLALLLVAALFLALYVTSLTYNPPGFFVDEAGISYNAYLIATSGANETGVRWPLMCQLYYGPYIQYSGPTHIYLLAGVFSLLKPSTRLARMVSSVSVFCAVALLGVLAWRISAKRSVGLMVALIAVITPWLFEISRLVLETFLFPLFLVLFLLAVHTTHTGTLWRPVDSMKIAATLTLLTYTYSSGRILAPLLALGLLLFATNRRRFAGVVSTIGLYAVSLIPLIVFARDHPGALTKRFYEVSYIQPSTPLPNLLVRFWSRYLQELNVWRWLVEGDPNPRHHVPGSLGSFLVGALLLSVMGILVVLVKHRRDRWWLFIVFGLAISIIPGAISVDQFHTLRLVALPIFLLVITIPAITWLLYGGRSLEQKESSARAGSGCANRRRGRLALISVLVLAALQAAYFQWVFHREGPKRRDYFNVAYKEILDEAILFPGRPIYLIDGPHPTYVEALWYATEKGMNQTELVHVGRDFALPSGAMVLSGDPPCFQCPVLLTNEPYVFYVAK